MLSWIREHLQQKGFEAQVVRRLELASEEALINVIQHAYGGKEDRIEIQLTIDHEQVQISIRDWGPPFDPTVEAPPIMPEASLEERNIGGLGIYLIQQIMDEVIYTREENANLLVLVKRFSQMR